MAGAGGDGPYEGQTYLDARPLYPSEWFSMLSALTSCHAVAWDVGAGNGQASLGVAEHYDQVIATDISEDQLKHGIPHPRVHYRHTPVSLSEDELVATVGGENSVDLVIVAVAIHWFDIPKFYSVVNRVLRKPGGVIAVWGYSDVIGVNPEFDALQIRYRESAMPYWSPGVKYVFEEYRNLPFPFESVGMGEEGKPMKLTMTREMNLRKFLEVLRSSSAVGAAKEKGVDLVTEELIQEFEKAWGAPPDSARTVNYNVFLLAGKLKE